jgi:diguanylate cyclase (GGDEF)-like protein
MGFHDKDLKSKDQAISKLRFIRRVNRMSFISIFIVILFVFFLVYQPMKIELEKSLIDNFAQISHTNYHSFESSIQRGIEGVKSLSSRTMIKNAIIDYKNGEISLEELKVFTLPKYKDGAMALEYLIKAERFVDGLTIAQYMDDDAAYIGEDAITGTGTDPVKVTEVKIEVSDDRVRAVIASPIMSDSVILGQDILVYDLVNEIKKICTKTVNVKILDREKYLNLVASSEKLQSKNEAAILKKSGSIYWVSYLNDDKYFVSVQELSSLFIPIHQLAIRIAIGGAAAFIGYAILAYFYIIRYTRKELVNLEFSRDEYKQLAYKDHLTGAYNRQFLDIWNHSFRSYGNSYAIVMIDVDDFKSINDIYGHITGDKVLQTIGAVILNSIRQSDFFVRYGGDEFVLILSEASIDMAHHLIGRIQKQLDLLDLDLPRIHLSFGMSLLTDQNNFEDLLKLADNRMYENKMDHKKKS